MKKILYSALALPLLFACSSEDFDNQAINNDPFAGIAKVDATFTMDEPTTRFDGGAWKAEEDDLWGFAWMGDGTVLATNTGNAYQNHNLIQKSGIFTPQTSIYVGKYYIYRPYDKTTVSPQAIHFESLVNQPLAEGYESHSKDNTPSAFKDLAKTAINIGDVWTDVSVDGRTFEEDPTIWNKAGIKGKNPEKYKIYAAMFSNQTGLDLTYVKNNPKFAADKKVTGATDIDLTYAKNTEVGAADIYEATVQLAGAAKSFTYAPKASPNGVETNHSGTYWANKKGLNLADNGFDFTPGAITLTPADKVNGLSTGANGSKAWFWFNSLPVTNGNGALGDAVQAVFTSSYGVVTVNSTVGDCASVFDKYDNTFTDNEWIKLAGADAKNVTPKTWNLAGAHNTFVNQYGNHKGKFALTVDFSDGVMNNMHIKSDTHLQKLLKYYLASGKGEVVTLLLDKNEANTFALSKISIALLQTINAGGVKVTVKKCTEADHRPSRIVITQADQSELGIADATDVPSLENVFAEATDVDLSGAYNWTWKSDEAIEMGKVTSITLLNGDASGKGGKLNVTSTNVEMSGDAAVTLTIAKGATMNITKVTTVKNALTNRGTINVGAADNTKAELRAYGINITNDATDAKDLTKRGTINNYGVIGASDGTSGHVYNYGEINVKNPAAITLLTSNEKGMPAFNTPFDDTHKMGSVVIPSPTALVSVSNGAENGFIKYTWPAATTTYVTPAGVVKYNTIVVSGDITFKEDEPEIQYIEFNGERTQVVNPTNPENASDPGYLDNLKGIIVNDGKSIIIEKNNGIVCSIGAFLGSGATIYKGGNFKYPGGATTNYFDTWTADQVVVW